MTESTVIPWRSQTNWTIAAGSLENCVTFESSLSSTDDGDGEVEASTVDSSPKSSLVLYPPSSDSGPCEIKIRVLKDIVNTLGKKDWDFNVDPCSGQNQWTTWLVPTREYANNVTCDCSFDNATLCHVVAIIVVLKIVSEKNNTIYQPNLLNQANLLKEKGNPVDLVDERLGSDFNKEEAMVMINVALLCTSYSPSLRPTMSSVVRIVEGRTVVQEVVSDPSKVLDDKKLEAMQLCKQKEENHCFSMKEPCTDLSRSVTYLHNDLLDSSY